jgi:hypothetical protein
MAKEMLAHLVDQTIAGNVVQSENLDTAAEYFALTEDAVDALAEHIVDNQERALSPILAPSISTGSRFARLEFCLSWQSSGLRHPHTQATPGLAQGWR